MALLVRMGQAPDINRASNPDEMKTGLVSIVFVKSGVSAETSVTSLAASV